MVCICVVAMRSYAQSCTPDAVIKGRGYKARSLAMASFAFTADNKPRAPSPSELHVVDHNEGNGEC